MINHSTPPGHNRDYFSRPRQSDRLRHDYGNTRLGGDDRVAGSTRVGFLIFWAAVSLSLVYYLAWRG